MATRHEDRAKQWEKVTKEKCDKERERVKDRKRERETAVCQTNN